MVKTLKQINEMIHELQTGVALFNLNAGKGALSPDETIKTQHELYVKLHHIVEEDKQRIDLILEVVKAHHDELPQSVKNILEEYSNTEK